MSMDTVALKYILPQTWFEYNEPEKMSTLFAMTTRGHIGIQSGPPKNYISAYLSIQIS